MELAEFFNNTITTPDGYFNLCLRSGGQWLEEWFTWPTDKLAIITRAEEVGKECDVYFSSHLFQAKRSLKVNVLPSRTIQADLDWAETSKLPIPPTVLVQTSSTEEGPRHQAYWVLDEQLDVELHEVLSRKLTYSIPKCDRTGWPLGHRVRVPGTLNFKYLEGPKLVQVVDASHRHYSPQDLELLPEVLAFLAPNEEAFLDNPPLSLDIGPLELLESIKDRIPPQIYARFGLEQRDRSAYLWALMNAAFRAGLGREQVFYLAYNTPNNKFTGLRFHGDRELAKDVLRAEVAATGTTVDPRQRIADARKLPGTSAEKRQYMADVVRKRMQEEGTFLRTTDEVPWYVRRDVGRPIPILISGEQLSALLDIEFGLNRIEAEQHYVVENLKTFSSTMTPNWGRATLSHYDQSTNALLLHSGKKDVIRITADSIEKTNNGSYGVVFPWIPSAEQFQIHDTSLVGKWHETVFGRSVHKAVNMSSEEALVALRVWMLFILFRSMAHTRPLLTIIGQPGAGKTFIMTALYRIIYGKQKGLSGVSDPEKFDTSVATYPFVAFDNADQWTSWLPDRLAQSAMNTDVDKRRLFFDTEVITMKRQAMVGVTAHDPRFWREDVADRMLLIVLERLDIGTCALCNGDQHKHTPERIMLQEIDKQRNAIWAGIVHDCQQILRTPLPNWQDIPSYRIADFAYLGTWFGRALGFEQTFRTMIGRTSSSQRSTTLDEEQILVTALSEYVRKSKHNGEFRSVGGIWEDLKLYAPDEISFIKSYKNAARLAHKLWTLHDPLRELFDISWEESKTTGARTWRITTK